MGQTTVEFPSRQHRENTWFAVRGRAVAHPGPCNELEALHIVGAHLDRIEYTNPSKTTVTFEFETEEELEFCKTHLNATSDDDIAWLAERL